MACLCLSASFTKCVGIATIGVATLDFVSQRHIACRPCAPLCFI
jgi:hypothetical protein